MIGSLFSSLAGSCAGSYRALMGRAAKVGAPASAFVAMLGDLGAPVAASNLILTGLCLLVTLLSGFMWFGRYQRAMRAAHADGRITQEELAHATETNVWSVTFAFGLVGTLILGFVLLAQSMVPQPPDEAPERGVLATVMPPLQKLQDSLFNLEKKVDAIAADTAAIKTTTSDIKSDTAAIAGQTAQVSRKLDDLARLFEEASKHDGLISNPRTAAEHYHNARYAELKADFATARKSYNAFLATGADFIDPALAYTDMLKVQDGAEGAREVAAAVLKSNRTLSMEAAAALLLPKNQRLPALEAVLEKAPDFAPAVWLLGREFSAARLGEQTIADKNAEKKWLDRFAALNEAGQFQKYVMDKKEGQKWLEDAAARSAKLAAMPEAVLKNPVTLTPMQSGDGWMLTLGFADYKIKKVEWRHAGTGDFQDTGGSAIINPQTGQPMPNLSIAAGRLTPGDHALEVRYTDAADQPQGPFKVSFNTDAATLGMGKQTLGSLVNSWVSLKRSNGRVLCYFTTLLTCRGALKTIRYSVDSEALDEVFAFTPLKRKRHA